MNKILKLKRVLGLLSLVMFCGIAFTFTACKENISDDAYAIAQKQTIEDIIASDTTLSSIHEIFNEVRIGLSENASVVNSALSARGNYTVFAPNNDAITRYIELVSKGTSKDLSFLSPAQKEAIALNCIIDNGSTSAYELADFPSNGMFATTNLKDRRISCKQDAEGDYILNDTAKVLIANKEGSNGMLHVVSNVIVPSDKSIYDLMCNASNMRIMSFLFAKCGYTTDESGSIFNLSEQTQKEEEYEKANLTHAGEKKTHSAVKGNFDYQSKRLLGYTAFVEPDSIFTAEWGVPAPVVDELGNLTNGDEILAKIKSECEAIYGTADADNYKSDNNAVRKFINYHLLEGKLVMEDRSAVHHWNEYGYGCGDNYETKSSEKYTVDVWDYYTTLSGAMIKITQSASDASYHLNRVAEYNTSWVGENQGDYQFKRVLYPNSPVNGLDIEVSKKNVHDGITYDNDGADGYYFPINHILVNNNDTRTALGSERIRIDFATMFPELITNNIRGNKYAYIPNDYFKNLTDATSDTYLFYLQEGFLNANFGFKDYQGDEVMAVGQYDFKVKLPRVPKDGTYELRIASSNNSLRGMVQIYIGDDPNRLQPVGLPIDQRETVDMLPGDPFVDDKDVQYDKATCQENDRNMRNQDYMKGPRYFHINGKNKDGDPVRNIKGSAQDACALRRILIAQHFDSNKTYYLRFKSSIPDYQNSQLFLDYIEFVPSSVYNGTEPEDIW